MLTPPADLTVETLESTVVRHWGLAPAAIEYEPVGWGSHHWTVTDPAGHRWFLTVDDLAAKRHRRDEPVAASFGRLRAALATATFLAAQGHGFVVAPLSDVDGEPVVRVGGYGVALYPFVDGRRYGFDDGESPEHRRAVLDRLLAIHGAPTGPARVDDFWVPHRDELERALDGIAGDGAGPLTAPLAQLLATHAGTLRRWLAGYDELVGRVGPTAMVLTHGEPHPGNTLGTPDGLRFIDWETVLVAPRERDLWGLASGDGWALAAYTEATGITPRPEILALYRIRWDLADVAAYVSGFRRDHAGSPDDDQAWRLVSRLVTALDPEPRLT